MQIVERFITNAREGGRGEDGVVLFLGLPRRSPRSPDDLQRVGPGAAPRSLRAALRALAWVSARRCLCHAMVCALRIWRSFSTSHAGTSCKARAGFCCAPRAAAASFTGIACYLDNSVSSSTVLKDPRGSRCMILAIQRTKNQNVPTTIDRRKLFSSIFLSNIASSCFV